MCGVCRVWIIFGFGRVSELEETRVVTIPVGGCAAGGTFSEAASVVGKIGPQAERIKVQTRSVRNLLDILY